MATRSYIGIKNANGKIRAIYCHWDGYPDHNGAILKQHYKTEAEVNALIDLGDLNSLRKKLAPEKEWDEPAYMREDEKGTLVRHSYDTPQKDVTVAYHRDRGEELESMTFYSENGFYNSGRRNVSYCYLFKDGEWSYARTDL